MITTVLATLAGKGAEVAAYAADPRFIAGAVAGLVAGLVVGCLVGAHVRRVRAKGPSRPKRKAPAPGMVEIYVGNLSYETDEALLRQKFEKYGKVASVRIISNRFNRKSKGFGFIEMPDRAEAEAAIKALHDSDLQGRKLRVNEALNKSI